MKAKSGFWLLNPASKIESILLALLFLFLPTQFGKHFWPSFSLVNGIRVDYLAPTFYLTDILIFLLFVFLLKRIGVHNALLFLKNHLSLLFVLLFFLVTALFALRLPLGIYWWIKLIEYAFLGLYIAKIIRTSMQITSITLLIAVSSFFESFLAILQFVNQGSLSGWLYYLGERQFDGSTPGIANASIAGNLILRPYGTFSHPNVLAGYLLLIIPMLYFFLIAKTKGFIKYFGIVSVIFSSVALCLTLSRVALLLFGILVAGFGVRFLKRKIQSKTAFFLVFAIIALFFVFAETIPFTQVLITRFAQTSLSEESVVERTSLMDNAMIIISNHPLTGVGLGNFIPALAPLQKPYSLGLYLQPVHNIFLLVLSETGFVGAGIFLWFLFLSIKQLIIRLRDRNASRIPSFVFSVQLLCILLIGLTDHYFLTLQQGQLLFTIILGFCWTKKLV